MQFQHGGNHLPPCLAKLDVTTNAGLLVATPTFASPHVKQAATSSQLVDGEVKFSMLVKQWSVAGLDITCNKIWEPFMFERKNQ